MKKGFVVSSKNIEAVMNSLKEKMYAIPTEIPAYLAIDKIIDRKKYKGRGRPRKTDYLNIRETLKKMGFEVKGDDGFKYADEYKGKDIHRLS